MHAIPAQADGTQCQRVIVSGDPSYQPFSWYDGKTMRGAALEVVTKALQRIQLPYEVRYVGPFARLLLETKSGGVDIIVELKDLPERRAFLDYSNTAMFLNPIAIFTRKDEQIPYHDWNDLRGLHGGITNANKFGGGFDEFLVDNLTVEVANDIKGNFDKLARRHIDYFITSYYPGMNYLMESGRLADFKTLRPYVTESANYVAWSKTSPCADRMRELDNALSNMESEGEIRKIVDAHLDTWRTGGQATKNAIK